MNQTRRGRALGAGLLGLLLALGAAAADPAADPEADAADEAVLRQAKVAADAPGLLAYFTRYTVTAERERLLTERIAALGDPSFRRRERALRELSDMGPGVLGELRRATAHPDPEVARRARRCVAELERRNDPEVPAAAARRLTRLRPAGALLTLMAYLPSAPTPEIEEEVYDALAALGPPEGSAVAAVRGALRDARPQRRAAAGRILGRHGDARQRDLARALLADAAPVVRRQTVRGLLAAGDRAAVAAVIDWVAAGPDELALFAEEWLAGLAGEEPPTFPADAADVRETAKRRRQVWADWWRTNEKRIDLAKATVGRPTLNRSTVALMHANKVAEVGRDGKELWAVTGLQGPIDGYVLPGGNILIAEYGGNRLTERDRGGKVRWTKPMASPIFCQPLPGGHVFAATRGGTFLELDRTGKLLYEHRAANGQSICGGQRLRNGRVLLASDNGDVCEYDPTNGKLLSTWKTGLGICFGIEKLSNGHYLLASYSQNKVSEYDAAQKVVWTYPVQDPFHVTRLANGRTLVAARSPRKLIELDRAGKVVREQALSDQVWRVRPR